MISNIRRNYIKVQLRREQVSPVNIYKCLDVPRSQLKIKRPFLSKGVDLDIRGDEDISKI